MAEITPPQEILNPEYEPEDIQQAILYSLYNLITIEDSGPVELYNPDREGLYFNGILKEKIGPIKENEQVYGIIDGEKVTLSWDYNPETEEEKHYTFKILLQNPIIISIKEKI
jgi:hypothetical protein